MRKLVVVLLAAAAVIGLAIGAAVLRPQLSGTTASPGALVRPQPGGVTAAVPEAGGAAPRTSQPGPADQAGQSQLTDRMIIYNVTLQLEVERVRAALARIEQIAQTAGGYVAGSNVDEKQAQVTIRVPAAELNRTLEQLRAVGVKVKGEQINSRDVTEEFSDLSAQLRNLQAVEAQYLALLQQARTVDEILKVRQRLDEVRGQIERLQGRIQFLQRQSDLAAITIILTEAPAAVQEGPAWDPIQAVVAAWNRSLVFLSRVADVGVQAVVFLWWVWVPAGLGFGFWRYLGRRRAPGAPTANP
mgnify:CR=1 FL=1|jgi:hypothetical protein